MATSNLMRQDSAASGLERSAAGLTLTPGAAPGRLEEGVKKLAFGRAGTPEEVAEAALFLISDKSSFTTGAILNVSGGA